MKSIYYENLVRPTDVQNIILIGDLRNELTNIDGQGLIRVLTLSGKCNSEILILNSLGFNIPNGHIVMIKVLDRVQARLNQQFLN